MAIELLNIDCMAYMRTVPDGYFDLAIVDPPYGINAQSMSMGQNLNRADGWRREESTATKVRKGRLNSGGGKLKDRSLNALNCDWDSAIPPDEYFQELFRISLNQIIWGGNYFPLRPTRCYVCWDKVQPWDNFSQFELAWTSFDRPAAMFKQSNTGGANLDAKIHPTQKPVRLYSWVLEKFAFEGARIIDTHLGSASSAIAAHRYGISEFVGCEINAYYHELAVARFHNETRQLAIF